MTIKEIEELSGMTRANIRYYESEGLLSPARSDNGYRDYSGEDLDTLKRIKLLRALHISLEEIKALHDGGDLSALLDRQLALLDAQREELDAARRVCAEMRQDAASYATLDAQKYLDHMDRPTETVTAATAEDVLPRIPWRRYFARSLDMFLYTTLWDLFLMLVCSVNVAQGGTGLKLLNGIMGIFLMLLVEPLLLHFWGTTPGKWLLGLYVTDDYGEHLSYFDAMCRTWSVLCRGNGLHIPIYSLVRNWKCYKACSNGEPLDWEEYTTLHLRDRRVWRVPAYTAVALACIGLLTLGIVQAETPKHRGELTPWEFCDNYNRYASYFKLNYTLGQDKNGDWVLLHTEPDNVIDLSANAKKTLEFTLKDGIVTGVQFHCIADGLFFSVPSCQDQMQIIALSMSGSSGQRFTNAMRKQICAYIVDHPYDDFTYEIGGLALVCQVHCSGYDTRFREEHVLVPIEGTEQQFALDFTVTKGS